MKKKTLATILCLSVMSLFLMGSNYPATKTNGSSKVLKMVENMTIEQKICQMIMPAMRTYSDTPNIPESNKKVEHLNAAQIALLTEYNFGGLCLFAENCTGTAQAAMLTSEIQAAAAASDTKIPMFLSIDQEGGYITRLATGTSGIGNMALGATGKSQNAKITGEIISKELSALGINVDFGPDTDVNNNPSNPIIGIRSFSDDPAVVANFATAYVKGLHANGIISCLKHFPGHGDTATDSHLGFPYISKNLEQLESLELVPFASALKQADMVMTAHIQFPQIESATYTSISTGEEVYLPATMSHTILTDLLRKRLGFEGIITTDALDMGAITDNFAPLDVAKMAINAGVDILLMPVEIKNADGIAKIKQYVADIAALVRSGAIDEARIDESVIRILSLKEKYNLQSSFNTNIEEKVANALAVVGSKKHHDIEWKLALDSITEVRNTIDDLHIDENTRILYICPWDSNLKSFEMAWSKLISDGILSEKQPVTAISYDGISENIASGYASAIGNADIVILVSRTTSPTMLDYHNPQNVNACFCKDIIDMANAASKKTILISSQLPYDANTYNADAVYLAYNPTGMTMMPTEYNGEVKKYAPNLPAAIVVALGGHTPTGTCPVKCY